MMSQLTPFINVAIAAVHEVQETLKKTPCDILFKRHTKGVGGDISIGADFICEDIYVKYLLPFGSIHSEERGVFVSDQSPEYTIVLDPLDGSDNFMASVPYYGTSISLHDHTKKVQAAVVANYCSGEIFFKDASYMQGQACVMVNGDIQPYCADENFPKVGLFEASCRNPELALKLYDSGFKLRSPGALALSLVYVRNCCFALYCGRLRVYDIEAAMFISNDLNIYHNEDCLLIARDKDIFESLKTIIYQS